MDQPIITSVPELPPAIQEAIEAVIAYNWEDECEDATYALFDGGLEDHIFVKLVLLDNWLNGTTRTPESYLDGDDNDEDENEGAGA